MKANQRSSSGQKPHKLCDEYKIPFRDRERFMGSNKSKWVGKKKYLNYLKWKKENR